MGIALWWQRHSLFAPVVERVHKWKISMSEQQRNVSRLLALLEGRSKIWVLSSMEVAGEKNNELDKLMTEKHSHWNDE